MSTRRAFFSSRMYFTVQRVPAYAGSPGFQDSDLAKRLRRISMSDGTRPGILGAAPPKSRFSPAASR